MRRESNGVFSFKEVITGNSELALAYCRHRIEFSLPTDRRTSPFEDQPSD